MPSSWTVTEDIAIVLNPPSRFAGRALALGILVLLASTGQVTPQAPSPVERVGQVLAEANASFARVRDYTGTVVRQERIGLHMADVELLLNVLHRLVDEGNTVIVIEHNLSVIAEADYIVDLGPEAGNAGGKVVATGTPEQIAKNRVSRTAPFLRKVLNRSRVPVSSM